MRTPALITLASLLALPLMASAEIYSWKDATGKTHYGDKPPVEKKVQPREIKPRGGTSAATTPAKTAESPATAAEPTATGNGPAKSAEQLKAEADARQSLCDNARKRLIQLEATQGIILTKNEKGETVPLVGDAKKAETDAARKDVEQWCK